MQCIPRRGGLHSTGTDHSQTEKKTYYKIHRVLYFLTCLDDTIRQVYSFLRICLAAKFDVVGFEPATDIFNPPPSITTSCGGLRE